MIRILGIATAAFILIASSAAMAGQFPSMDAAIDAGNHSESEATLAEAQALIPN